MINKTCETCDYTCPGHLSSDTCENWEHTIWSIDVPEEVISMVLGEPTNSDIQALYEEIDSIEKNF